jgi:hypothetical protein
MVTKWGMSDKLGPLQYEDQQEGYLGMSGSQRLMASEETNKLIDSEIRALVDQGYARASEILNSNVDKLHLLAQAMLEYETLTGEDIKTLMEGGQSTAPKPPMARCARSPRPAPPCPRQAAGSPPGTEVFSRKAPEGRTRDIAGGRAPAPHELWMRQCLWPGRTWQPAPVPGVRGDGPRDTILLFCPCPQRGRRRMM